MPNEPNHVEDARSPVREIRAGAAETVDPGMALCLSGGGYRAMVFHVGVLWRLNEVGYLSRLQRVSSVSGGSITAGVLGLHWKDLGFDGVYDNLGLETAWKNFRTVLVSDKRLEPEWQERLIDWAYAVCDAALRAHVDTGLPRPAGFPYPRGV
jgi:predicted acylesterase/phospholipase RssA